MRYPTSDLAGKQQLAHWFVAVAVALTTLDGTLATEPTIRSTTSRHARDQATRAIPFDRLTDEAQKKIHFVTSNPSVFRRIWAGPIDCDADLFVFLTRHPEVIIGIWDLMGITEIDVTRTGEHSLIAKDGQGMSSQVELIYGTSETHLIYASGVYEGPLAKQPAQGKCVLQMKTKYTLGDDDQEFVTNQLDLFIRLENVGADLVAKTLNPLVGRSADFNFRESIRFLSRISRAAEKNRPGLQRLAQRLDNVEPDVRRRFALLSATVSDKKEARRVSHPTTARSSVPHRR